MLIGVIALPAIALPLCFYTGVNRQATLHLSGVSYAIGLGIFLLAAGAMRTPSVLKAAHAPAPKTHANFAAVLVSALIVGGISLYLLEIAVPYLPGSVEQHHGIVNSLSSSWAGSRICDLYADLTLDSGSRGTVCLERRRFRNNRLAEETFSVGDPVVVTIRVTRLGIAIESLKPV